MSFGSEWRASSIEFFAYDDLWRLRAVYARDPGQTTATCRERYAYNPAGLNGKPTSAPLDSPVFGQIDSTGDGMFERSFLIIQNHLGDVIKIIGEGGFDEEIRYTLFGEPYIVNWYADVNHDGGVDGQDIIAFYALWDNGDGLADLDGQNGVDGDDVIIFLGWWDAGQGSGLTLADNRFGFRGYVWDDRLQLYHVRHRVYDPTTSPSGMRWLQRDPAFFVDGLNLYAYCAGDPVNGVDPMGLYFESLATRLANSSNSVVSAAGYVVGVAGGYIEGAVDGTVIAADQYTFHAFDPLHEEAERLIEVGGDAYAISAAASAISRDAAIAAATLGVGSLVAETRVGLAIGKALQARPGVALALEGLGAVGRAAGLAGGANRVGTGIGQAMEGNLRDGLYNIGSGGILTVVSAWTGQVSRPKAPGPAKGDVACFVATTQVATPEGDRPIEELAVGDRVLTTDAASSDEEPRAPTWRVFQLEMPYENPPGDIIHIKLLRPATWLSEGGAKVGDWITFALPEMGIQGKARVVAESACPKIKPGPGRVVLVTVTHLNRAVVRVQLLPSGAIIEPTATHRLYSLDRQAWVCAGALREGERLRTRAGEVRVGSIESKPGVHQVFNLEVQSDHEYFVGRDGVLGHNTGACSEDLPVGFRDRGPKLGNEQGREFRVEQLETYRFDPNQPKHVRGWLANEVRASRPGGPATPPGYVQGHRPSTRAEHGFDYTNSVLQGEDLNKLEEACRRALGM